MSEDGGGSGCDVSTWAAAIEGGDRRALARAITRVESTRDADRAVAEALLAALAGRGDALRLGVSGAPGVGKSSFVEAAGLSLVAAGARIAVLAVDPSSLLGGGSILGDKTRMERLARAPEAFVRPTPSRGEIGGAARRTRETIRLVEAAGYDIVIVETVGVGQSETMVADMTDIFLLLIAPGGGDELQGVKRGVMERADFVLVNKADGALEDVARATVADYAAALRLMRRREGDPDGVPAALAVSARTGAGMAAALARIADLDRWRRSTGRRAATRREQARRAVRVEVERGLAAMLDADPSARAALEEAEAAATAGRLSPEAAAAAVLAVFRRQDR